MAFEIVDGMTGTKHISSDDLAALNTATVGKASCVLDYGNDFSLTMASANAATLGTGVGMVGGKRFWNQAPVQLTVESGAQGQKRNDLVVARYSKTNEGIESIEPVVIKGTPTTGTAADPATTANDLKLWRVPLNGITVGTPVKLFSPVTPLATLGDSVSQLKASVSRNGDWYIARVGNNATILFFHKRIAVTNFQARDYVYKYNLPSGCGTPISGFVNAAQWRVKGSRVTFPSDTQVQIVTVISESTSDGTASDPYYNDIDVAVICVK